MYPTNDPFKYGRVSFLGLYYSFKQAPRTIAVPEKQRPQLSGSPSRMTRPFRLLERSLGQPFWAPRWSDGGQGPIFAGRPPISPTGSGTRGGEKRPSFLQGWKKTCCFPLVWCRFFFASVRSFASLFRLSRACESKRALSVGGNPKARVSTAPAEPSRAGQPPRCLARETEWLVPKKEIAAHFHFPRWRDRSHNLARQAPKFGERKRNAAPAPLFPLSSPAISALQPLSLRRVSEVSVGNCLLPPPLLHL